ncbi:MAG: hypothetical protein KJ600_05100 [Nanoarchaeota archaeon]|nr:hypothetical protein [Nanoarchaeota archaeon]MBU1103908.1 hypothetical protein [Nanoarchaeota archaeon]
MDSKLKYGLILAGIILIVSLIVIPLYAISSDKASEAEQKQYPVTEATPRNQVENVPQQLDAGEKFWIALNKILIFPAVILAPGIIIGLLTGTFCIPIYTGLGSAGCDFGTGDIVVIILWNAVFYFLIGCLIGFILSKRKKK